MPVTSEAQRRAMFAAREGRSTIGIPKSVGEKFVGPGHDLVIKGEESQDAIIVRKAKVSSGGPSEPRGAQVHPPRPRVHATPPKPEREKPQAVKARMTPTARDRFIEACDRYAADKDRDADEHADDTPNAAGIMFVSPQGRILFTRRTKENYDNQGEWDFPGGRLEKGETSVQAARRETEEETSHDPEGELREVSRKPKSDEHGDYVTYVNFCESEWEPDLDDEHDEYVWATLDDHPEPLHPGVAYTLSKIEGPDAAMDMALDAFMLALDYASVREYDTDGYLHVKKTPISKANICPYMGSEIPGADDLGLDPKKLYYLLRDPEELAKGAASFHGKPLLDDHEPTSADDHQTKKTVGAVFNPTWEAPYVMAELVVWPSKATERIESGIQKQLSSGYRYVPDMTPGTYMGARYDGVMRQIEGNHVALVKEGRAGSDVVVGDSMAVIRGALSSQKKLLTLDASKPGPLEGQRMPATAAAKSIQLSSQAKLLRDRLIPFLKKRLATDAEVRLPLSLFSGITKKNYAEAKPVIFKALKKELKGKLAQDASLQDIHGLLDSLSPGKEGKDNSTAGIEANSAVPLTEGHTTQPQPQSDEDMHNMIREHLMGKMQHDDIEDLIGKLKGAHGEDGLGGPADATKTAEAKDEHDDEEEGEDDMTATSGGTKESDPQFQAADDPEPFKGMPKPGGGMVGGKAHDSIIKRGKHMPKVAKDKTNPKVRQQAMDAAIKDAVTRAEQATIARLNGIAEAHDKVRPWVGRMSGAFDSAEGVYRAALKSLGVEDADKMHSDALLPVLKAQPTALKRSQQARPTTMAADASPGGGDFSFEKLFPTAAKTLNFTQ